MHPILLHLSHAADAADGGIATAIVDLISAQGASGLPSSWVTANPFPAHRRDQLLLQHVLAAQPGLIHLHGLWRSPTRIATHFAAAGLPLLIAPHGMLDPWALAHSRWKKRLVWRLWENRALTAASCLQALCPAEVAAVGELIPKAKIALIPNGVAIPDVAPSPGKGPPPWSHALPSGDRVLLFFGRFHAKKGLEPLLNAWNATATTATRRGWWLALVGYGDGGALSRRVAAAQVRGELPQVLVLGPCFGDYKADVLASASAFVLPSYSEGLPMAALEAMAHQLPCMLSRACNLPEAVLAGAALPAEPDPIALAASLQQLFALSTTARAAMGAAGRSLVSERYNWAQVAKQTRQLYGWILGGGERPGFVERG